MQDQFIFVRVQGPQIDIQDKNQLSMLRQQLEEQKRQKEAGGNTISEEKTTTTDGKENYLTIYYTLAIHRNNYIKLAENMHAIDIAARNKEAIARNVVEMERACTCIVYARCKYFLRSLRGNNF